MYVITGATGHTGSVITRTLLAKGQKVRAIARSADRLQPLARLGAEPFPADVTDTDALVKAFTGAKAVYLMIPPTAKTEDYRAFQDQVSGSFVSAIRQAGVQSVVMLSSFGADKAEGTGPVVGLHVLEEQLNEIPALNALKLRAGYFMENTLSQAGLIQKMGITAGPLRADLQIPIIATRDIGVRAAEELERLDFHGQQTPELLGQRDLTMTEAAAIIGKAIGRPGLTYTQLPDEQVREAMMQLGLSRNVADLLIEMTHAMNSGHMRALEPRSPKNTTPTSYETFVQEEFVPLFEKQKTAV
jgi:uncharacterized protein YbjT (DUF2867 family)